MIYSSKQNSLIKKIASLKDKKGRREQGLYVVEGVKMVIEAFKFNQPVTMLIKSADFNYELPDFNVETIIVSSEVFKFLSDEQSPQGVMAVIKIADLSVKQPLSNALILDGVSDPGNLGTIIRTAAASGYKNVYLISCADPFSPKVVRASMSGIYFVNLHKSTYNEVFTAVEGYDILVADMGGENVFKYKPNNKFCIVIGNEANGVSKTLLDKATKVLSIPMEENFESLNAGVAASIMMYSLKN